MSVSARLKLSAVTGMARPAGDCAYAPPVTPQIASAARTPHLISFILLAICGPHGILNRILRRGIRFVLHWRGNPRHAGVFDVPASIGPWSNRRSGCGPAFCGFSSTFAVRRSRPLAAAIKARRSACRSWPVDARLISHHACDAVTGYSRSDGWPLKTNLWRHTTGRAPRTSHTYGYPTMTSRDAAPSGAPLGKAETS